MAEAKSGDNVKVHYKGTLDDGTEFDSSAGREPLEFTVGANQVIPGFDNAVVGMNIGDKKTVNIPLDEAYGPRRDDMLAIVDIGQFPENISPEIGQELQLTNENDELIMVKVVEINESDVTLDANHPLAGENLTFDLELMEIS
ncbi:peptidylprolyl isomerase [Candidatus Latescibacterota bacterium]